MTPRGVALALGLAWPALAGCAPLEDVVFDPIGLAAAEPFAIVEGAGQVDVPLRLTNPAPVAVSARYTLTEIDAQSSCQAPDFYGADGRVLWPAGEVLAKVSVRVADDDVAELDEAFALKLDEFSGLVLGAREQRLVILDDDRDGIVDARAEFDLVAGRAGDQSAALAVALERAAELGRGVVLVPPGDYEISGATLTSGTTLSGRGAHFHRPLGTENGEVLLRVAYEGAQDSARTLLEGLTLDGRRDEQGPFQNDELVEAHLIALAGSAAAAGRARAALEGLTLDSGPASGVFVGPQADLMLCRLHCTDLWRDAVTLRGGGSALDVRELDASASLGTTGLWFDGQPAGFGGSHRIDVTIEDTELDSGDLEIEAYGGSRVELTRFQMAHGPLRVQAPDATVRITDSVLETGLESPVHDYFGLPHDMVLTRTLLVVSPTDDDGSAVTDAVPALVAARVRWRLEPNDDLPPLLAPAAPPHSLTFEQCRFERGESATAATRAYAVTTDSADGSVRLRGAELGPNLDALAPSCDGCVLEP